MTHRKTLALPEPFNVLWEEMRNLRRDVQRLTPVLDLLDTPETSEELGPGAIASLILEIDSRQRHLEMQMMDMSDSIATIQTDLAALRALLEAPAEPAAS